MSKTTLVGLAAFTALAAVAGAQQAAAPKAEAQEHAAKTVTQSQAVEVTATIEAIDHTNRLITLKGPKGNSETIHAGADVKRFNELKVGDTVTFKYQEAIAYRIRKAGEGGAAAATGGSVVPGKGPKPGVTATKEQVAVVTIKAIDPKVPAVTVENADGDVTSVKVEDPKALAHLKVGDRVEIAFRQALMISVK